MNATGLINELKISGYNLYLEGGNLRYKLHSLVEPPKERITFLLDSLRKNKTEVISYLRENERPIKPVTSHETGLDIQKMSLSEFEKAGRVLKVWSGVLQEHVFFVSSGAVLNRNTLDAVAYTAQELQEMLDMTREEVKATHSVKTIFHKARVAEHRKPAKG